MGRPRKELSPEQVLDLLDRLDRGEKRKDIARGVGVSTPTLSRIIADIQQKHGLLTKYRDIQSLRLTELQAAILESITEENIAEASLSEKIAAFKILSDKERVLDGKPSDIKGLVGLLIQLEKEEAQGKIPEEFDEDISADRET